MCLKHSSRFADQKRYADYSEPYSEPVPPGLEATDEGDVATPVAAPQRQAVPSEQVHAEKRRQYVAQPIRLQPDASHWAPMPAEPQEVRMQCLSFSLNLQLDILLVEAHLIKPTHLENDSRIRMLSSREVNCHWTTWCFGIESLCSPFGSEEQSTAATF